LNERDARNLVDNGIKLVAEGANMPTTAGGVEVFLKARIAYAPGKASNAGGVSVSALEMTQNSLRYHWTREEVDAKLRGIMTSIHDQAAGAAQQYGVPGNYVVGANIAGFLNVANAMMVQGVV